MEKRVLLAVILSFVVLYGYQALFPPKPAPKPQPASAPAAPATTPTQAPGQPKAETPSAQPALEAAPIVADTQAREVRVESAAVSAVFSTRGGVLTSWRLKKYQDPSGQPLELVPQSVPEGTKRPFALTVDDAATTAVLQQALFKPSAAEVRVQGADTLTFDYQDASGLTASKRFVFSAANPYLVEFSATVARGATAMVPAVEWGPAIGLGVSKSSGFVYNPPPQPIYSRDGEVTRVAQGKVSEHATVSGTIPFAGVLY